VNRQTPLERISAYLDGESPSPAADRAWLHADPEAQRVHAEWEKLAQALRSLEAPEVPPAFATRVMARLREAEAQPRPRLAWWRATVMGGLLAAAAVALMVLPSSDRAGAPPAPGTAPTANAVPPVDLAAVTQALEMRLATVPDEEVMPFAAPAEVNADDMLAAMAGAEWFNALAETVEADADLETLLTSLDRREEAALRQMLIQYAREG